jgi:predicted nucleic acid-binding protein
MAVYVDASALVKRYVREPGSDDVVRIFEAADQVFTCKVAFAEVMATFRRKQNEGIAVDGLTYQFQDDWGSITSVALSPELLVIIRQQAFQHPLRALDLLHLSAALLVRDEVRISVIFVCSDQNLLAAARREDLETFDPQYEDPDRLGS